MIVICIYLQVFFFGSRYENKSRGDLFLCCIIYFYIISLSFFSYRFYCYMLVFISKYFAYLICFFFWLTWVDPGQPIWPVTRSLDRVDHRVGFQNYEYREIRNSCLLSMKKLFKIFFSRRTILLKTALFWFFLFLKKENVIGMNPKMSYEIYKKLCLGLALLFY